MKSSPKYAMSDLSFVRKSKKKKSKDFSADILTYLKTGLEYFIS